MNTQDCLAGEKNADMYETAQLLELGYGSGLHFWCHLRLPAFEEVIFSLWALLYFSFSFFKMRQQLGEKAQE